MQHSFLATKRRGSWNSTFRSIREVTGAAISGQLPATRLSLAQESVPGRGTLRGFSPAEDSSSRPLSQAQPAS